MKVVKEWNNISTELKKQIPQLKPEQVVTIQMLNGMPNQDPDPNARQAQPITYGKTQIPTQFRIYDKYKKNSEGDVVGGYVDMILSEEWIGDNPTKAVCVVAGKEESIFLGKIDLRAESQADAELYEILFLSPYREGTPCPDKSKQPLFRFVDVAKDSNNEKASIDNLREALTKASELVKDESKAKDFMASQNRGFGTPGELTAAIFKMARDKPETFLTLISDENVEVKAEIKSAFDKEIISHDPMTGKILHNGSLLTTVEGSDMSEVINGLANWIDSAQNGKKVMAAIKKQLKGTVKQAELV